MNILVEAVLLGQPPIPAAATAAAVYSSRLGNARLFGPKLLSSAAPHHGLPNSSAINADRDGDSATPLTKQERRALESLRVFLRAAPRVLAPSSIPLFTYMELFAGVGGFSLAAEKLGGRCVFASELEAPTAKTWSLNFACSPPNYSGAPAPAVAANTSSPMRVGDIRKVEAMPTERVDLLLAGFPCQPWSRSGDQPGFQCPDGHLYLQIIRALKACSPSVFLLENVPGLESAKEGEALAHIVSSLREVGYDLALGVMQSDCVLPQRRKRLYFCGFRRDGATAGERRARGQHQGATAAASTSSRRFRWPRLPLVQRAFSEIMERDPAICRKFCLSADQWKSKLAITDELWRWFVKMDLPGPTLTRGYRRGPGVAAGKRYLQVGRKFIPPGGTTTTTAAAAAPDASGKNNGGGGDDDDDDDESNNNIVLEDDLPAAAAANDAADPSSKVLTEQMVSKRGWWKFVPVEGSPTPRFFTHREACRMQGFAETFLLTEENETYGPGTAQMGNAVSPPIIFAILRAQFEAAGVPSLWRGDERSGLAEMLLEAVPRRSVAPLRKRLLDADLKECAMFTRLFVPADEDGEKKS